MSALVHSHRQAGPGRPIVRSAAGTAPRLAATLACVALVLLGAGVGAARADLAITDVTLLDGTGGPAQPGVTVLVRGERILAVDRKLKVPRGMRRIDGRGKFLMPGLMDMHIHLIGAGQWRGLSNPSGVPRDEVAALSYLHGFLYWGVTSVYDAGNDPALVLPLRARERAGEIVSPRIFATGHALSYPGSLMAGTFHGVGVPDWPQTQASAGCADRDPSGPAETRDRRLRPRAEPARTASAGGADAEDGRVPARARRAHDRACDAGTLRARRGRRRHRYVRTYRRRGTSDVQPSSRGSPLRRPRSRRRSRSATRSSASARTRTISTTRCSPRCWRPKKSRRARHWDPRVMRRWGGAPGSRR